MRYMQIMQYVYLAFAVFSFVYAFFQWQNSEDFILPLVVGLVSLGMFFFRRHFYNKYNNPKR